MANLGSGPLLRISGVSKRYRRDVLANDDISLDIYAGEVFGLLGHNGAGKTTLINQVIGLARPSAGSIQLGSVDAVADPAAARRMCSLQPQTQAPFDGLTPREAIDLMARMRGADRARASDRTEVMLRALRIEPWADRRAEALSGGVRRLTAFGMAAVEPARLVMLDEPTNDVDPVRRRLLWRCIRELAEGGSAVVLVTHNVAEAERAVERLAILDRGRVVAQGTPGQLRGTNDRVRLELVGVDRSALATLPPELATAESISTGSISTGSISTGRSLIFTLDAERLTGAIGWAQRERGCGRLEEFMVTPVSLEDVYVRLVGHDHDATESADADRVA